MEECQPTIEQLQEEQSALIEDLVKKCDMLRVAEKTLENIRIACISSMYWKNDMHLACARLLSRHHKIVINAQKEIKEKK